MDELDTSVFAIAGLTEAQAVSIVSRSDDEDPPRFWELIDNPRDRLLIGDLDPHTLDGVARLLRAGKVRDAVGETEIDDLLDWIQTSLGGPDV